MSAASAFAARRAAKSIDQGVEDRPKVNGDDVTFDEGINGEDEDSNPPPKKRQRKAKVNPKKSQATVKVSKLVVREPESSPGQATRHAVPEDDHSPSDDSSATELSDTEEIIEDGVAEASERQLCTFRPTTNSVLGDTPKEWAVWLGRKDVSATNMSFSHGLDQCRP